jgi:hypothetical protein
MKPTTPVVRAFAELADGFCAWCETTTPEPDRDARAAQWLAKLHAAAVDLPETDGDNEEGLPEIPAAQLAAAERNLNVYAGWYYRTVFDTDPANADEPVMGDVGDDLLDTYKDIKAGALLSNANRVEEALWHWSFMHRFHWGRHALGALVALHAKGSSGKR